MPDAQPKPTAAAVAVIAAEEQRIRAAVDFERHFVESVGVINGMRRALRVLAAAGLLAAAEHDAEVQRLRDELASERALWSLGVDLGHTPEQVRRAAAVKALRDAADHPGWEGDLVTPVWLRRRAARIAAGEEP